MRFSLKQAVFGIAVIVVAAVAFVNAAQSGGTATVRNKLTIIAPASPGGGWDGFAREAQLVLREDGIVNNVQVVNVPGAGGTIGLSQLVQMHGRDDVLMVTGGVMIGAISVGNTPESIDDVTPVARLADDYAALVVPADSDIETFEEFVEAWRDDPTGVSIAGGSLGGIDHLVTGMLAREIGIDPEQANYLAYSGGGETLSALLSHTTTAGMAGYNEFAGQIESGTLRLLAVSAPEPIDGIDAPTFIQGGVDVQMANWRGFVAPPGLTEPQVDELRAIIDELHGSPGWADVVARNAWTDNYMVGDEFSGFLDDEQALTDEIVEELGL
ncbi:C4-dicarboxylate ABC transporter substrate-binding protein [Pseudoclavibacter endophyticus]|uniref:Tripartite tricarboxylate transporter substrate binding protein n=1 Tax=Pseudoclavibacter endophyticus TaxID=1778590 RepID=A0A6H9WPY6_9MICO|nr:tripartite tricarboxylate transporter substrate-binding protein [Pseudoclavibacter endophyticus]KAB1649057.1 tripartite tricarboxylate transporter substrate binding protein [Pseudoclavibacter endophyticus]GGA65834.1 C4-dicarboxylate ABC transporter substrate-binding protein [Pseudoclavibacter endophyticus]